MKKITFLIPFIFWFVLLFAQSNQKVSLTLHLKNGDIISGVSAIENITFETDFGTLNFPIKEVNSIDLGLQDSRFDKATLLNFLEDIELGNDKKREAAFDAIAEMDEGAIPFIKAYLEIADASVQSNTDLTVQTLYDVMLAKHNVPRNFRLNDVLTYNDMFKVEGHFKFTDLNIEADFANLKIDRNSIQKIDIKAIESGLLSKNTFKVYANHHISSNKNDGWLNTGILVKKGQQIKISAKGQVVLASLTGNTYTPDGGVNGNVGPSDSKLTFGQVAFKIGQNDDPRKAGDSFTGIANQTGIVYIAIHESVFNSANSGYYTVNVEVQ